MRITKKRNPHVTPLRPNFYAISTLKRRVNLETEPAAYWVCLLWVGYMLQIAAVEGGGILFFLCRDYMYRNGGGDIPLYTPFLLCGMFLWGFFFVRRHLMPGEANFEAYRMKRMDEGVVPPSYTLLWRTEFVTLVVWTVARFTTWQLWYY